MDLMCVFEQDQPRRGIFGSDHDRGFNSRHQSNTRLLPYSPSLGKNLPMRQRLRQFEFRELWRPKPRIWSMNEGAQCLNTVGWTVLWWNLGGTCDEDGNWRVVCAPPRTDNARTRPQGRVVVRELVIPSAPEHLDYLGQDGGCRSIHSA